MTDLDDVGLGTQPSVEDDAGVPVSICPGCGAPEERWQGDGGAGYLTDDAVRYCCAACFDQEGCTCA